VQNGGTLVATFNTGLVDEHNMAPDTGYPHDLTDFWLGGVELTNCRRGGESPGFQRQYFTSHLHPARLWCDIIGFQGLPGARTYAKDSTRAGAITMHNLARKAIYVGTMSHQHFYGDP
jgi:hypothetical protein